MSTSAPPERSPRRVAPLILYAAILAVTWILLLTASSHAGLVTVALVLQLLVGALMLWRDDWDRWRWMGIGAICAFLVSVALLRQGVGESPAYGVLVLLPVIWASLRSHRFELGWALIGAALVLFLPIVVIGGVRYPASQWRSGAVLLAIAMVLGIAVLELVARLRASEQRYRLLADYSTDLVARLSPEGRITYASPSARVLLGYDPDELVGMLSDVLLHPDDRPRQAERRAEIDATANPVSVEVRLRHRDGRWTWFEATTQAIRDPSGAVSGRQAAMRLIDERKRLQVTVEHQRVEAAGLLAEQRALREIATLVASGAQPDAVFHAVAEQVARLLGGRLAGVVRFNPTARVGEVVGGWSDNEGQITGEKIDLAGVNVTARVFQTGASAHVAGPGARSSLRILEPFTLAAIFAAPITAEGRLWGSVGVTFDAGVSVPGGVQQRLARFAALVTMAIVSAEALETLSHQATTDSMTGLANYRTFHERLASEFERSLRYGRDLSVAVLDLDRFKQVNDLYGHPTGDRVLAEAARRLNAMVRSGELIARIGGEEFGWLLPETTEDSAFAAAERVRRGISATPFEGVGTLTFSVGLCSNAHARTAQQLFDFADQALYRSKSRGRNATSIYTVDDRRARPGATHLVGSAGPVISA